MRPKAFTLIEITVSVVVLAILVILVSQMVNSATVVTTLGSKRMDTDSQVRPVLDRMALDLAQMIRRSDVDYYVKGLDLQAGNDRIALFSQVTGYYPSPSYTSPLSLVAYRVNGDNASGSYNKLERMGKGLLWNTISGYKALIFGPSGTVTSNWPYVASNTSPDPDSGYEVIGPQIFRFEYFYLLKTGLVASNPGSSGMQDVTAIVATLAAIDSKSRVLISDAQIDTLIGRLKDFDPTQPIYDLTTSWQAALDATNDMPRSAIAGVRIYQRNFYLSLAK